MGTLTFSGVKTSPTGNCGHYGVTGLTLLKDSRTVSDMSALQRLVSTPEFEKALSAFVGEYVLTLSHRVANNYADGTMYANASRNLMLAMSTHCRGVFISSPPIYNPAHPTYLDSVIMTAHYIPEALLKHRAMKGFVYRDGSPPDSKTSDISPTSPISIGPWRIRAEQIPDEIKAKWNIQEVTSYESTGTSQTENSSVDSTAPPVAPVKRRSRSKAKADTSTTTATVPVAEPLVKRRKVPSAIRPPSIAARWLDDNMPVEPLRSAAVRNRVWYNDIALNPPK